MEKTSYRENVENNTHIWYFVCAIVYAQAESALGHR